MLIKVVGNESSFRHCVIKDRPLMWVVDWKNNFASGSQEELLRDLLGLKKDEDIDLFEYTDDCVKGNKISWDVSPRQAGVTSGRSVYVEKRNSISPRRIIVNQEQKKSKTITTQQQPKSIVNDNNNNDSNKTLPRCASTGMPLVSPPRELSRYFTESNYVFISQVTRICKWINKQQVLVLKPTKLLLCGSKADIKKYIDVRDIKSIWNVTKKKNTIVVQFYTKSTGQKTRKERDLELVFPASDRFVQFKNAWLSIMRTLQFKRPWGRTSAAGSIPENINPPSASPTIQRHNSTPDIPQIIVEHETVDSRRRVHSAMVPTVEDEDDVNPEHLSTEIYSSVDPPSFPQQEEVATSPANQQPHTASEGLPVQSTNCSPVSVPSGEIASPPIREVVDSNLIKSEQPSEIVAAQSTSPEAIPWYPQNGRLEEDSSLGSPQPDIKSPSPSSNKKDDKEESIMKSPQSSPKVVNNQTSPQLASEKSQSPHVSSPRKLTAQLNDEKVQPESVIKVDQKCYSSPDSDPPSSVAPSTPDCEKREWNDVSHDDLLSQNERLLEELRRKDECIRSYQIALNYKDRIITALQEEVANLGQHSDSQPPSEEEIDDEREQEWVFNL